MVFLIFDVVFLYGCYIIYFECVICRLNLIYLFMEVGYVFIVVVNNVSFENLVNSIKLFGYISKGKRDFEINKFFYYYIKYVCCNIKYFKVL